MADLGDQEKTIQEEAKECRSLLTDTMVYLSQHDPHSVSIELQDEMGRFNLWAGNIGVFAPLQASLDFRLIDVPDIRSQFLRQLGILSITLIQLNEAAAQSTTEENEDAQDEGATRPAGISLISEHGIVVELVQSIHVTIDWLHRLSNLVRKASFGSQNQRAAEFPLKDEAGNDIAESLAQIFKHLIKRECHDISDLILNRMAQTIIIRRRRVLYRRSRQKRWALQQEAYRPRNLDPPVQLAPMPEVDGLGEDQESSRMTSEVKSGLNLEDHFQTPPSGLTVTTLDQQKFRRLAAPSRISRATTAPFQHDEKLLVPPRPILAKEETEFVCDYCCLILPSSEAADQKRWANHVKKDLDPYICVFDSCNQPYQIFSSSKEWLAHMRSEHRMSWRCVVRDHPPQFFETRAAFLSHMTQAHPGKFRKEQLPFVAESSARALTPTVPACPFCAEDSGDLKNHVAQHLCHFALQSLPWPDHLDQDSEIISRREMSRSTSEDFERETLKDDLDEGLGFIDADWVQSGDTDPEPLLDTPVSWPNFERIFPMPDQVLVEFAAHAARRATKAPNDNPGNPETLDEELRQLREKLPNIEWKVFDKNTRVLRAILQGPWGFEGGDITLNVNVAFPHTYPGSLAPSFLVEEHEYMPEVVRQRLQRGIHEICQRRLERKESCLEAAFSYLLGAQDLTSSTDMFDVESEHGTPPGDLDASSPPYHLPSPLYDSEYAKVAENCELTPPGRIEVYPKSGYLATGGKGLRSRKTRFYVIDGSQLKYYDARGGAQLGSIDLQGAQIRKQQPRDDSSSGVETRFDHAMLISEPNEGSEIRHILYAGSDEERDLWIEALLPCIDKVNSNEEVKTAEHGPRVDESQTGIPNPSAPLIQPGLIPPRVIRRDDNAIRSTRSRYIGFSLASPADLEDSSRRETPIGEFRDPDKMSNGPLDYHFPPQGNKLRPLASSIINEWSRAVDWDDITGQEDQEQRLKQHFGGAVPVYYAERMKATVAAKEKASFKLDS